MYIARLNTSSFVGKCFATSGLRPETLTSGFPRCVRDRGGPSYRRAAWVGKAVAGEVAGMVPFVRDVVVMVEGYSHEGVVGAESWMSTIVKAAMDGVGALKS